MRGTVRAALLSAVVAAIALPALPASAVTAPLPETVLRLKSIHWQHQSGSIEVTARVKCTGDGTFEWGSTIDQGDSRARNSSNVPCDGDGYLSTLVLDPKRGRFHPGKAEFTLEHTVMNDQMGISSATLEMIRISAK